MAEFNEGLIDAGNKLREHDELRQQATKQLALIESISKQKMSREAISRYGTLKIAHPETAIKAIALIAQATQLGQIKDRISDEDFKSILKSVQEGKQEFRFRNLG